ncbi:hypothetical protein V7G39_13285, partial [Enterococcus faecium]
GHSPPPRFLTIFSYKWDFYHVERKWSRTWEAEKTYQAPQAKKVRVTSKKEKFFRTTFENLILIYIRSI